MKLKYLFIFLNKHFLKYLPDSIYFNLLFLLNCFRLRRPFYFLNIFNPKTFNEKIIVYSKLNLNLKAAYSDKLQSFELLKKEGINILRPTILYVFDNYYDFVNFDFQNLEKRDFIIKANHGSGLNKIFCNGKLPSLNDLEIIGTWFSYSSSLMSREKHYSLIDKKVFIEKLISENIRDYKFHCFNGQVCFVQLDIDRFVSHRRNIYTRDMRLLNLELNYKKASEMEVLPRNWDELLEIVEDVARISGFEFYVRVDLYCTNEQIYFGEITFHPGGGVEPFDSRGSDLLFGNYLTMDYLKNYEF